MRHAFLEAAAAYPIVGEAIGDFHGPDYGSEYLILEQGDGVLLLPSPSGAQASGWAYGRRCGPEGWFPPSCFKASARACEVARSQAVQNFTGELKLSAKLADKLKTALLKQNATLEQDLEMLEDMLAGQKDPGALIGNVVKGLGEGITMQELLADPLSAMHAKKGGPVDEPKQGSVACDDAEVTSAEMPQQDESLKSLSSSASEIPYVDSRNMMLQARHANKHDLMKYFAAERTALSGKGKEQPPLGLVQIAPSCIAHVLAAAGGRARLKQICVAVQGLGVLRVSKTVKDLQESVLAVVESNPRQFRLESEILILLDS